MTITLTEAFREAVEKGEILLFSSDPTQLNADFEPGQSVPPFTAYVWNEVANEWFLQFGTELDEPTMMELVDLMTSPPADLE